MGIETTINGVPVSLSADPGELLLDVLRDRLGLTGAKRSCDVQVCGTCTVLLDGRPVSACTTLVHEARGRSVLTIEGFAETAEFARIQEVFTRHTALQCGYCTPGMALTISCAPGLGRAGRRRGDRARGAVGQRLPLHRLPRDHRRRAGAGAMTTVSPAPNETGSALGHSVVRKDADEKMRGAVKYVGDTVVPGMLHGKVLRSEIPAGRIRSIDTAAALAHAGGALRPGRHRPRSTSTPSTVTRSATARSSRSTSCASRASRWPSSRPRPRPRPRPPCGRSGSTTRRRRPRWASTRPSRPTALSSTSSRPAAAPSTAWATCPSAWATSATATSSTGAPRPTRPSPGRTSSWTTSSSSAPPTSTRWRRHACIAQVEGEEITLWANCQHPFLVRAEMASVFGVAARARADHRAVPGRRLRLEVVHAPGADDDRRRAQGRPSRAHRQPRRRGDAHLAPARDAGAPAHRRPRRRHPARP